MDELYPPLRPHPHKLLERIGSNPDILRGRPRIKGRRVAVHTVLEALAIGLSVEEVMLEYGLERDDIAAALLYAARLANYEWVPLP